MYMVLLPAYNEERDIRTLLLRIRDAMLAAGLEYKIFVVNDGSTDGTLEIVRSCKEELPVEILDHGVNKGLGQAMLTGLSHVASLIDSADVLVTMDADNTHDPCLIAAMGAKIGAGAGLVIASRYEPGGEEIGLSRARSIFSRGASCLLSLFFPVRGVKDYTCGFRAYSGEALKDAFRAYGSRLVEERGFTCMAEILIKMRAVGVRMAEVPLVLRYDLKAGRSKMNIPRTILRYFVLISHNLFPRPVPVKGAQIV